MTLPLAGLALGEHRTAVEELVRTGYTDVWSAETAGVDGFAPLLLAATWAPELHVGTAVVPAFTRGPALLAQHALALAEVAPGRCTLGLGSSSDVIVGRWNGIPFERPYYRVRDTLRFLRRAFTGDKVRGDFDTFDASGFRLEGVAPQMPPIYLAGLRGGMLRLAGREADGAIINWMSPDDVPKLVGEVHEGCRQAGRSTDVDIVARIFVLPTTDAEAARAAGRKLLAAYMNVPVYKAYHQWLGREDGFGPMWKAWEAGDRKGALAAIPDEVVDDIVVWGPPEQIRERVGEYVRQGVTVPVVAPMPGFVDPMEAIRWCAPSS